ncbi:heavy-metal-associated domain-containing protein [Candidatus Micrarchaeota archaeon]|nr:heavy-metal-associated domain-containing protein [Candidatus Micrarchaeota archaeon]
MEIKIEEMNCKSIIERELAELECIGSVHVSLEDKMMQVVFKEKGSDLIPETIENLGFSATVMK